MGRELVLLKLNEAIAMCVLAWHWAWACAANHQDGCVRGADDDGLTSGSSAAPYLIEPRRLARSLSPLGDANRCFPVSDE
jgi:hypothetical protein